MRSAGVRKIGFPSDLSDPMFVFPDDSTLKAHAAYRAAKAGDAAAAVDVVRDLAVPLLTAIQHGALPADYFVAPHAREASGDNAIPQVLASACAAVASAEVDTAIVQTTRVYHTGADAMERLALRPVFVGDVISGRSYCLVDDVTNLGGTLAELADFIQFHGARIVGVAVLVNAGRSKDLHPPKSVVTELAKRYVHELERLLSVAPEALTANEANYLIGFRSLDEIRNRISKARKETDLRLRSKGISGMESPRR
jgi:phosphoribosylpyrophosphate synthetase